MSHEDYFRRLIFREIDYTLDVETRLLLRRALDEGPRSAAWIDAITIVGLRTAGRGTAPPPGAEERIWRVTEARRRRGRFVAIVARVGVAALIVGALYLFGYYVMPLIVGWP